MTTANGNEAPAWGVRLDSRRLLTGIPEEVHIEDVMQVNGQCGTWPGPQALCWWSADSGRRCAKPRHRLIRIRNIMIPDMYYRDDIGERWFGDHDKLHTWGYLREV
jgi:phosphoribosylamine--glycine ligase